MSRMKEQPTIADIAGHCNEPTAWRIIKQVSDALLEQGPCAVAPCNVTINDDHFQLVSTDDNRCEGFEAPECIASQPTEAGSIWSLGATVFFVVMGRQVMNGEGGKRQKANSKLPYMRSTWPTLSELVQHCLDFNPENRPTVKELNLKAQQECRRCDEEIRRGPKIKTNSTTATTDVQLATETSFWPEAF